MAANLFFQWCDPHIIYGIRVCSVYSVISLLYYDQYQYVHKPCMTMTDVTWRQR